MEDLNEVCLDWVSTVLTRYRVLESEYCATVDEKGHKLYFGLVPAKLKRCQVPAAMQYATVIPKRTRAEASSGGTWCPLYRSHLVLSSAHWMERRT